MTLAGLQRAGGSHEEDRRYRLPRLVDIETAVGRRRVGLSGLMPIIICENL